MCGIAGYVGAGDRDVLRKMTDGLKHRGPDDEGAFAEDGIGLGFRRLSIIDLAGGHQPMSNDDGSVRVVFNGEIYNYKELRKELEGEFRFTTSSDTEVVLHLYEKMGERAFGRLWGMFAIAVWDGKRRRLVVARDRLGKKPVYLFRHGEGLVFASEMKAVLAHPAFRPELDLGALASYFERDYLPRARTAFRGVEKLPPATYGVWHEGRWETKTYWSIGEAKADGAASDAERLERLEALLADATARRLVADVPVGVFLSGGVDSSLIAALAVERSAAKVKTFSIGFREKSFDESGFAREVASRLGTEHQERIFGADEALASFDEVGAWLDEPFADPSILPTYLLSKTTRERVTVALSGDGGDEVFWGYATFKAHRAAETYRRLPSALRSAIAAAVRLLPPSDRYMSLPFVLERFTRGADLPPVARDRLWRASVPETTLPRLFTDEAWRNAQAEPAGDAADSVASSYLFDYLPNDILYKADRASMAASLEVRSPLLDHRVVEMGWTLPERLKLRGLTTKVALKKILEKRLPGRLAHRKKQGFALPVASWLRGPLREACETYFSAEYQRRLGLFREETVSRWWREHLEKKRDHRKCLWSLLMFCRWHERWVR